MQEPTVIEQPPLGQSPHVSPSSLKRGTPYQAQKRLPMVPFRLLSKPKVLPTKTIRFWFRTRLIHAAATQIEKELPNVLLLQVAPSIIDQLIGIGVSLLPLPLRALVEKFFPEWNMPSRLALKTHKKGWDEEFEVEKSTYAAMKDLQGIRIPKYYGELKYNGTRAILLSDIGGACIGDPAGAILGREEFRRMMNEALTDLARFGVLPDDIRLENFHLINGEVMIIDFEMVRKCDSKEDSIREVEHLTDWLAKLYEGRQQDFLNRAMIAKIEN
ncbi:hypothetical protein ED733_003575 [Metarhizium rileyi]|uniref:Protein kinase-like domain protein n=1 Tax=Metarhizium rileyi (strain RCEF 4871) TaxID=1649241 RepID=A0A5C6G9R3_METRR|nr:hypothetical protein ED733_003575 [Metarhizium rileyi]